MAKPGGTRLGGFPLWVWAVAGFGAIAVGLLLLPKSSSSSSAGGTASNAAGDQPTSQWETNPFIYIAVAPNQPVNNPAPPTSSPPAPPPIASNPDAHFKLPDNWRYTWLSRQATAAAA